VGGRRGDAHRGSPRTIRPETTRTYVDG
jgi:hypothetical protein